MYMYVDMNMYVYENKSHTYMICCFTFSGWKEGDGGEV